MRVPGLSACRRGFSLRLNSGERNSRPSRRRGEVHGEEVVVAELDALGHAGAARVFLRIGDAQRVDIDAHGARAELRGGDHDAPVAAAEVVDEVAGLTAASWVMACTTSTGEGS